MSTVEERWATEPYCYLTTTGRRSGKPHEIEIWFAAVGDTIYLMNGTSSDLEKAGQSDWVKNLQANPSVRVRIGAPIPVAGRTVEALLADVEAYFQTHVEPVDG